MRKEGERETYGYEIGWDKMDMRLSQIHTNTQNHTMDKHNYMYISFLTFLDRWAGPPDSTSQTTAGYLVPWPPRTENPNDHGRPSLSWALSSTTVFLFIVSYTVDA